MSAQVQDTNGVIDEMVARYGEKRIVAWIVAGVRKLEKARGRPVKNQAVTDRRRLNALLSTLTPDQLIALKAACLGSLAKKASDSNM